MNYSFSTGLFPDPKAAVLLSFEQVKSQISRRNFQQPCQVIEGLQLKESTTECGVICTEPDTHVKWERKRAFELFGRSLLLPGDVILPTRRYGTRCQHPSSEREGSLQSRTAPSPNIASRDLAEYWFLLGVFRFQRRRRFPRHPICRYQCFSSPPPFGNGCLKGFVLQISVIHDDDLELRI